MVSRFLSFLVIPRLGFSPLRKNMLDKKTKDKLIKKFQVHGGDTGSSPIQIAILTEEIKELTDHLKTHKKDFSSRRGLLKKVAERRRLLIYLKREDAEQYGKVVKELKLKFGQFLEEEEKKNASDEEETGEKSHAAETQETAEPQKNDEKIKIKI